MLFNGDTLKKICPTLTVDRANKLALLFETVLPEFGMYSLDVCQEFIAQVAHESGEFSIKTENMNYSAARLVQIWPGRFPDVQFAQHYANHGKDIANYVYGKRMGNTKPGDGWAMRGSGFMQATGRDTATRYAKYAGIKAPENSLYDDAGYAMELCRTDDYWALHSACWEFALDKHLIPLCHVNDFKTNPATFRQMTLKINGGYNGYEHRVEYLNRAVEFLK